MYADALGLLVFGASLISGSLSKKIFDRLKIPNSLAVRDFIVYQPSSTTISRSLRPGFLRTVKSIAQ